MNTSTHRCGQTGTEQCYSKVVIAEKLWSSLVKNKIKYPTGLDFGDNKLLSKALGSMVKSIAN